jgi:RNA-directed DNA polymerase
MWLKVPVEERDEKGRPRYSGGRRSKQGTPQGGVISPLLANIYINRLLKVFAASELGPKHGARIINYADDFVVVALKGAAEVLAHRKREGRELPFSRIRAGEEQEEQPGKPRAEPGDRGSIWGCGSRQHEARRGRFW